MISETTVVAKQYRFQEWAAQIRDCRNRPEGMNVVEWCAEGSYLRCYNERILL